MFDSDGDATGPFVRIADGSNQAVAITELDDLGFALLFDSTIQIRSASTAVVDEHSYDDLALGDAAIACVDSQCAATVVSGSLKVLLFNATALNDADIIAVKDGSEPQPNERVYPVEADVACETSGLCLVTWGLKSETVNDQGAFIEPLGVFGRVIDLHTGEMGPEALLVEPDVASAGADIAFAEPGLFALALAAGSDIVVRRVAIE